MSRIDILNRDRYVEQLCTLVENISLNKTSTCFAIDGVWGSGKSFVLDMFQKRLEEIQSEETANNKYFVVKYNCWKYDYYDEPLISIVADILSNIEEQTKLFPESEEKRKVIGMLKAVGCTLLSIGNSAIKSKTGLDLEKAYRIVSEGEKDELEKFNKNNKYDPYFAFKKIIEKLSEVFFDLSKKYTLVFLVDELDRCLPEYAIKVLERLHHLTEGQTNIITVISIDKEQLTSIVQKIFGFSDPEKYLEKFISFYIELDFGDLSEKALDKYADYISLFDKDIFKFDNPVEECIKGIFSGIDIRNQEQLVKKAMLAHNLLYRDEKKDYSFMCMELLLTVMICKYKDDSCFSGTSVDLSSFNKIFTLTRESKNLINPKFIEFFKKKFESIELTYNNSRIDNIQKLLLPTIANLYGAILFTWYWMHEKNILNVIQHHKGDVYEPISKNHEELKKFAETIRMIK